MTKTNAVRLLEQAGIPFSVVTYRVDESALDAVSVAHSVGVEPERVFKTLVAADEREEPRVFCVPGPLELDLKKAAAVCGSRRIALVRLRELQPLTGYVHGGCSPIGMKRRFATWIDETAELYETILVSAGARGAQLEIEPHALARFVDAVFADLTSI